MTVKKPCSLFLRLRQQRTYLLPRAGSTLIKFTLEKCHVSTVAVRKMATAWAFCSSDHARLVMTRSLPQSRKINRSLDLVGKPTRQSTSRFAMDTRPRCTMTASNEIPRFALRKSFFL